MNRYLLRCCLWCVRITRFILPIVTTAVKAALIVLATLIAALIAAVALIIIF